MSERLAGRASLRSARSWLPALAATSGFFLALAAPNARASSGAASLVHQALSDARASGSVRVVQKKVRASAGSRANGATASVTDAAAADGHQVLTGSGIYAQVLVVNNLVYVKGSNKKSLLAGLSVAQPCAGQPVGARHEERRHLSGHHCCGNAPIRHQGNHAHWLAIGEADDLQRTRRDGDTRARRTTWV